MQQKLEEELLQIYTLTLRNLRNFTIVKPQMLLWIVFFCMRLKSFGWIETFLSFYGIQLIFEFNDLVSVLQLLFTKRCHFL